MVHERTMLAVADNSGAKLLQIIRVLGNTGRRYAYLGDVIVAAVKIADPKGQVKKSDVVRAVVVRVRKEHKRPDGSAVRFDENAAVVIQKEGTDPIGTRVFGPIAREVRNKGFQKIASLAAEVW